MEFLTQTWRSWMERARRGWRRSALPGMALWWLHELSACLPARMRAWLARGQQWRTLSVSGDSLLVTRPDDGEALARLEPGMTPPLAHAALHEACAGVDDEDLCLLLCLPPAAVLRRRLTLPEAALERLPQVVAYEMDRQTPFKADQVYYDVRETPERAPAGQVAVEILVVPRIWLDPWLERLHEQGIAVDAVDAGTPAQRAGFNLLPPDRRVRRPRPRRRLNALLAAAAAVLMVLAMLQWVHNREQALHAMQQHVAALRSRAFKVAALRKQLADRIDAAGFLARKKAQSPSVLEVLDTISQRLPDDTWLERLTIGDDDRLGMQGQSPQAAKLIDLLKASPLLHEPGFQGVIQSDPRTGKERFFMVARIQKPGSTAAKGHKGGAHAPASH